MQERAEASNHAPGTKRLLNGPPSSRCCRIRCAAFGVSMTVAYSMASFGSCVQVRRGATCPRNMGHTRAVMRNAGARLKLAAMRWACRCRPSGRKISMSRGVMLFDHDFADIRLITIIAAARHPLPRTCNPSHHAKRGRDGFRRPTLCRDRCGSVCSSCP
jgi:hypothetical protein